MSELDDDSAVRLVDGAWRADISPRWNIGPNPNGGYLLAIAGRAVLAAAGRPDPLSVTAHYVTPPVIGPADVAVDIARSGRRYSTLAARITQGGADRVRLLAAVGDLDAMEGPTHVLAAPPEVAPPDRCRSLVGLLEGVGSPVVEAMRRYDLRLPPDSPWLAARAAGAPVDEGDLSVTGWIRFADGADPSALALLAFSDAFPPTLVGRLDVGWVPTVELTVHVRGRPAAGWVLGAFRTRFLVDGLFEQDGELWDSSGRLVALSRQLALVLPQRR